MLSPNAIKEFYDRFGARQDSQAFYEDRALDALLANAALAAVDQRVGSLAGARHRGEFTAGRPRQSLRGEHPGLRNRAALG